MKRNLLIGVLIQTLIMIQSTGWTQPANDNCSGYVLLDDCPPAGSTAGTTVGATASFAPYGCYGGQPDVWYLHQTGPTDNSINISVTAGTLGGNVQVGLLVANCSSTSGGFCNCPFLYVNSWCAPGAVNVTNFTVTPNTTYFILVSGSGSTGTFNICVQSSSPPPQPGQDCPTAEILCGYSGPITLPLINAGNGAINEGTWTGDCIGLENNSQWYQFTVSQTGTFALSVNPAYYVEAATSNWCGSPANDPCRGDDYDFGLYDITATGCPAASTNVSGIQVRCNYSACRGSTGFANTPLSVFGQAAGTHYCNVDLGGSCGLNCTTTPQWSTSEPTLTAGSRYALLVQNYSGGINGVTISMAGTAVIGPQANFTTSISGCNVTINNLFPSIPNYSYSWDFGDGTNSTSSAASFVKTYSTGGTYTISLAVVDQLGCVKTFSQDVTVCPLPVEMKSFTAYHNSVNQTNRIEWVTNSEINNYYFTLESSPDGVLWKSLVNIPGGGNSNVPLSYFYDDKNYYQLTYYRLKQTDYDGTFEYFGPISVMINPSDNSYSMEGTYIYPNPTEGFVTIDLPQEVESYIAIYDILGRMVWSKTHNRQKQVQINLNHLTKGSYVIRIETSLGSHIQRIIKE